MVDISQKPNIQPSGAFPSIRGLFQAAFKNINTVMISEGAANARIRKAELLSAKSDEELAIMGIHRDDIFNEVFRGYLDI